MPNARPHPHARWTRGNHGVGHIDQHGDVVTVNAPEQFSFDQARALAPNGAYAHFTISPGGHVDARMTGPMSTTEFYRLLQQAHRDIAPKWTQGEVPLWTEDGGQMSMLGAVTFDCEYAPPYASEARPPEGARFEPQNDLQALYKAIGEAVEAGDIERAKALYRQLPANLRPRIGQKRHGGALDNGRETPLSFGYAEAHPQERPDGRTGQGHGPSLRGVRHADHALNRRVRRVPPLLPRQHSRLGAGKNNDPAARFMAGLPHWIPSHTADHRRWEYTADDGITHRVGCGSSSHTDAKAQKVDYDRIRQRVRKCEGNACMCAQRQQPAQYAQQPQGQPQAQPQVQQRPLVPGEQVTWQGQQWHLVEMDGEHAVLVGLNGQEDIAPMAELQRAASWTPDEDEEELHPLDNTKDYHSQIICPNCDGSGTPKPGTWEANSGIETCQSCYGKGATHGSYPNRPAQYIGYYDMRSRYGGPEEGGWNYNDTVHKRSMPLPKEWVGREDELFDLLRDINKNQRTEYRINGPETNAQGVRFEDDPKFWEQYEAWSPEEQHYWDNDVDTGKAWYLLEHEPGEHHDISLGRSWWDGPESRLHGARNDPDYGTMPRITDPFLRLPAPGQRQAAVDTGQWMVDGPSFTDIPEMPVQTCPSCGWVGKPELGVCPQCGHEYVPTHELRTATYENGKWVPDYGQRRPQSEELQSKVFEAVGAALKEYLGHPENADPEEFWYNIVSRVLQYIPRGQLDPGKIIQWAHEALAVYENHNSIGHDEPNGLPYSNDPDQPRLQQGDLPWTELTPQQQQAIPSWGDFPAGANDWVKWMNGRMRQGGEVIQGPWQEWRDWRNAPQRRNESMPCPRCGEPEWHWGEDEDRDGHLHTYYHCDACGMHRMARGSSIADQATEAALTNGGVTLSLGGDSPTHGYVFSPYPDIEKVVPVDALSPIDVEAFIHNNIDLLRQPGHYLGMWQDGPDMYIDVSKVGPPTPATVAEAASANQLAVWDIANNREIRTGIERPDFTVARRSYAPAERVPEEELPPHALELVEWSKPRPQKAAPASPQWSQGNPFTPDPLPGYPTASVRSPRGMGQVRPRGAQNASTR